MTQWGLDTLFNPAKRHMDEEKQRLQSTREEVGDNSGGKRIDLESGRVTIKRGDDDGEDSAPDVDASGEAATADGGSADTEDGSKASEAAKTDRPAAHRRPRSAAQRRAALRRGLDPDR